MYNVFHDYKQCACVELYSLAAIIIEIIIVIAADDDCLSLILQAWYLDDGVLAGPKHAVLRALSIIEDLSPSLGIFINLAKCELFSHSDVSTFPPAMKVSHMDILGTSIGEYLYCTGFFAMKSCYLSWKMFQLLIHRWPLICSFFAVCFVGWCT